ncbi:hypothetical protein D6789_02045 [Candidatus Woesearchaeota archaeon]|nr:MAG: hypothetical protein D6789_02045 [Candidatus Woesearchaeota archaeon]
MEQTPSGVLHRLMITMLFIGFLAFFLKDTITRGVVLAAGGLVLIWGMAFYYKIKKNGSVSANKAKSNYSIIANKSMSYFYILIGIVILILPVFVFERDGFKDIIFFVVVLGLFLLILGLYMLKSKQAQKTTWKELPLGFKILIIFLSASFGFGLYGLTDLQRPTFLLGMTINPPLAIILTIAYLIIPIITIFLILQKTGWKILLGLQSFNVINRISGSIKILITPLPQMFAMTNRPLPDVPPEVLQAAELQAKLIASIPLFIGVIIALAVVIYVYKEKGYFSNQ